MSKLKDIPSSTTVIRAIAASDGKLSGHPGYLTKLQMIELCKKWLAAKAGNRKDSKK